MALFKKAERQRVFMKLALTGPSGSGKTLSALLLAQGLAGKDGKIAVLDTENESASLYADRADFDTAPLGPPFTIARYIEVINGAVDAGYDVLVIDSLSHCWAGEGGLLAQKEALDARGGNKFSNWAPITKQQEALKSALLQSPIHLIATMRVKQEYVVGEGADRNSVKKVGLGPVQREGFEYEFTTVFDIGMGHEAVASKDRTGLFDGVVGTLTPKHGQMIRQWLSSAAEPPAPTNEQEDGDQEASVPPRRAQPTAPAQTPTPAAARAQPQRTAQTPAPPYPSPSHTGNPAAAPYARNVSDARSRFRQAGIDHGYNYPGPPDVDAHVRELMRAPTATLTVAFFEQAEEVMRRGAIPTEDLSEPLGEGGTLDATPEKTKRLSRVPADNFDDLDDIADPFAK